MGKIGERLSRNMYKGHMDTAKMGRIKGGKQGWMGGSGSGGWKIETTVLEKQCKKFEKKS